MASSKAPVDDDGWGRDRGPTMKPFYKPRGNFKFARRTCGSYNPLYLLAPEELTDEQLFTIDREGEGQKEGGKKDETETEQEGGGGGGQGGEGQKEGPELETWCARRMAKKRGRDEMAKKQGRDDNSVLNFWPSDDSRDELD